MKKAVYRELRNISAMTLCRMMDDCLPEQFESERDMFALIKKIWPVLLAHQECEQNSISEFLEENAPVYDNWQMIDGKYCCEKLMLQERERLSIEAKGVKS